LLPTSTDEVPPPHRVIASIGAGRTTSILRRVGLAQLCLLMLGAGAAAQNGSWASICSVGPPPSERHLDSFYRKYCITDGIPIASSEHVPDAALQMAADIVSHMLAPMPAVRDRLAVVKLRIAIISEHEVTSDIPEYKPLVRRYPEKNYDERTRGIGANSAVNPVTSGAEENLLCYPTDRYRGENIFVHELSHSIKKLGLEALDPGFGARVVQAYDHARLTGLWARTYSMANAEEYWAEGVQSYFDANSSADPPNGIHNAINTRAKLKDYDPALFAVIDGAFAGAAWRPRCP